MQTNYQAIRNIIKIQCLVTSCSHLRCSNKLMTPKKSQKWTQIWLQRTPSQMLIKNQIIKSQLKSMPTSKTYILRVPILHMWPSVTLLFKGIQCRIRFTKGKLKATNVLIHPINWGLLISSTLSSQPPSSCSLRTILVQISSIFRTILKKVSFRMRSLQLMLVVNNSLTPLRFYPWKRPKIMWWIRRKSFALMIQSRKFTLVVMATMNRKELSKLMKQTATRICRLSGEKLPRKCRIRRKRVNSNGLRPNTRQDRQPRVIAPLLPLRLAIDSNNSMLWESTKH